MPSMASTAAITTAIQSGKPVNGSVPWPAEASAPSTPLRGVPDEAVAARTPPRDVTAVTGVDAPFVATAAFAPAVVPAADADNEVFVAPAVFDEADVFDEVFVAPAVFDEADVFDEVFAVTLFDVVLFDVVLFDEVLLFDVVLFEFDVFELDWLEPEVLEDVGDDAPHDADE
jgi:hypothetical protein